MRLLEFALLTFSPKKIFSYLGRKWHERFDGEVRTALKSQREPGACIKHFMKKNWLKMYDKLGSAAAGGNRHQSTRENSKSSGNVSIATAEARRVGSDVQGVGNLPHYQHHALACNYRYLEALTAVDDPTPGYDDLEMLTEAQRQKGRSYAGFNPVRQMEARLLAAVLAGEHIAKGFLNRDIRVVLYPSSKISKQQQRRDSARNRDVS